MIPEYWWPYLYQYGVGGAIFIVGLIIILKTGACRLSRKQDRFWFTVLVLGFFWYAGGHFLWYEAAIHFPPPTAPTIKEYMAEHKLEEPETSTEQPQTSEPQPTETTNPAPVSEADADQTEEVAQ